MDGVKIPADLDALLRRTMAEEPSVEFLPRVRERIATEHVERRWWWRPIALAGAAAAVVIGITIIPRGIDDATAPPPPARPHAVHTAVPNTPANPLGPGAPALVREPVRAAARLPQADVRAANVEGMAPVIVDERQRAAIDRMMFMVSQGRVTEENFALTVEPSLQPIKERVGEIAVVPVDVSPIDSGGVLQLGPEPKQPPRPADAGFRP